MRIHDKHEILKLYEQGMPIKHICEAVGCAVGTVYYRLGQHYNDLNPATEKDIEEIIKLHGLGFAAVDIRKKMPHLHTTQISFITLSKNRKIKKGKNIRKIQEVMEHCDLDLFSLTDVLKIKKEPQESNNKALEELKEEIELIKTKIDLIIDLLSEEG